MVHCTLGRGYIPLYPRQTLGYGTSKSWSHLLESSKRYGRLSHERARLTKERPSRSRKYTYGIEQIALGARQGSGIERRPPRADAGEGTVPPLGIETYFGRCGIGELAKTLSSEPFASEPFAKPDRPTASMSHADWSMSSGLVLRGGGETPESTASRIVF